MSVPEAPVIDAERTALIHSGVAIDLASYEPGYVPVVGRGVACRVRPGGREVTVFLSARLNRRLLDAVAGSRAIAAVLCHPRTLETLQLKGSDARVSPASAEDAPWVADVLEAFIASVMALGTPEHVARHLEIPLPELRALTFTIGAAFVQTPGPSAGARL